MNDAVPSAGRLAVVLKGWPRLSETFIAQELVALEQRGLRFEVWSMRHPTDKKRHALHDALKAKVRYLPEYLYQEPLRVLKGLARSARLPGFGAALKLWLKHLVSDPTPNRVRRFGQAAVLAREASPDLNFVYAHFMHTPSSVALYAAMMRGVEWGFSAHAKDIWKSPDWEKRDKLERATFGVTCTSLGAEHLRSLSADPAKLDLVYHGLDLSRFPSPPPPRPPRDGSNEPVTIISVGRLVEKKGYNLLLDALAKLPAALKWRFVHIGGGDLSQALKARAKELGLSEHIEWRGARDQGEVISALREADIFMLPSRIASDGDRDGLPNVLMEAASQELPILSTSVSSIPEFIENGRQGILVEPDAGQLGAALAKMIADPEGRARLAAAARTRLVESFGMDAGIDLLSTRLATALAR
ncbi:glycosyltransferase [Mesorhizobium sp. YM1C-6-2]|uniref:glycosyltransferase n=1 Tax=Mesorhizobium sp. YM1C-6-2 TaxID=1827501 RepID=UPI000EF2432D|nr:glycosyltransferase [Mesorhizobium sp. YM1C-6-2]RLP22096.1 colanic acid biosynthesis glycosyltransferase WcaL [Mesorhizobium sp. YM1C-6-2]